MVFHATIKSVNMVRIKSQSKRYITITEREYLELIESAMVVKALKIAGVETLPIYNAVRSIISDGRVQIHIKPLCRRYSYRQEQ